MVVEKHIRPKDETTDEEQNEKFLETVQLLLAAGYFRARIKGLTPFDKVVGGMVWCMSTCDFDIDVDLLFQENSTIGQKIALTEKIVAVLPRMKCPHRIEPHQIQGLDFIHIFPVIQWLVKQAMETREEQGDRIRAYSISQFHKNHEMPQDVEKAEKLGACISAVKTFQETYGAKRKYKKPESMHHADEQTQVHSTLLEYGHKYTFDKSSDDSIRKTESEMSAKQKAVAAGLGMGDASAQDEVKGAEEEDSEEKKKIESLMKGMSEADIEQMLSSRTVGSIVGLKLEEISTIAQHYAKRQEALEEMKSEASKGSGSVQAYERQLTALTNSIKAEQAKLQQAEEELLRLTKERDEAQKIYQEELSRKEKVESDMEHLNQQQNERSEAKLSKLRSLVARSEQLKTEEQELRTRCKQEKKELDEDIAAISEQLASDQDADSESLALIKQQLETDNKKLRKIRLLLGKKNREISSLQWQIDDVPSRAELAQYQRRFIELYNQVASTHKETKQFYSLYNTLDDKKIQLDREVGILNSIYEGFGQAHAQSNASRDEFVGQLEKIAAGVGQNVDKAVAKMSQEKEKRDRLNEKWIDLNEKQRLYFKTVKEFQEECKRSEVIQTKLESLSLGK